MDNRDRGAGKIVAAALLWGAVWGSVEATLGFVLHFVPVPGLAGALMFPVGFFCLQRAQSRAGVAAMALVPVVAAALKLLDLFLPGQVPVSVLHPALSILLQGVMLTVLAAAIRRSPLYLGAASLLWKAAFVLVLLTGLTGHSGITAASLEKKLLFFGLFTGIEVGAALLVRRTGSRIRDFRIRPAFALGAFALAASLHLLFASIS